MRVHHNVCCGIDVHKETVVACVIVPGADGKPLKGAAKNSFMAKCEKET